MCGFENAKKVLGAAKYVAEVNLNMGKFIERFNDYSCIVDDGPNLKYLSHYTSKEHAVSNICTGEFWVTDMMDFDDLAEGRLILQRIRDLCRELDFLPTELKDYVFNYIGDDQKIEAFISQHRTAVLSMCVNTDSTYLWDNYAKEDGYNILFDKEKFDSSLCFYTVNGDKKCNNYIKRSKIIYDTEQQIRIIKSEFNDLLKENEMGFTDEIKMEYILYHLMYIGNFYKKDSDYKNEEEYRYLVNMIHPTDDHPEIKNLLPEYIQNTSTESNAVMHHIILKFDPKSIIKIICNSKLAKEKLEVYNLNIPIEMRKYGEETRIK